MKLMLREGFDIDNDGIVDKSQNVVGAYIVGAGGIRICQVVWLTPEGTILAANAAEESQAGRVVGMTEDAGSEDEGVSVLHRGEISNDEWDLVPGAIYYLASGGEISPAPPIYGFCQKIGIGKTNKIFMLNLGEAIILA